MGKRYIDSIIEFGQGRFELIWVRYGGVGITQNSFERKWVKVGCLVGSFFRKFGGKMEISIKIW